MRANGIDFSKWAPEYDPILSLDPISVEFVVHRLAHGITEDIRLKEHAAASVDVPVREGYIYYEMTSHWYAQVELSLELAKEHNLDNVWWDAEEDQWQNTINNRFLIETAAGRYELSKEYPGAGIYCNLDVLYHLVKAFGREYMDNIPLWIADPRHNGQTIDDFIEGVGDPRRSVWYGGNETVLYDTWTYWQTSFQGDPDRYGIIGKKAVDENVFNGTPRELYKLRGKSLYKKAKRDIKRMWNRLGRIRPI